LIDVCERGARRSGYRLDALAHDAASAESSLSAEWLTITIGLIAASVAAGSAFSQATDNPVFTLSAFGWTFFVGA